MSVRMAKRTRAVTDECTEEMLQAVEARRPVEMLQAGRAGFGAPRLARAVEREGVRGDAAAPLWMGWAVGGAAELCARGVNGVERSVL